MILIGMTAILLGVVVQILTPNKKGFKNRFFNQKNRKNDH
jgi:hypothetical protein